MLLKSIRRMCGLRFGGQWRWTHHFLLVIWLSQLAATPPIAHGYFLGDTKAVLDGCRHQWTLQDGVSVPRLSQMTVCVDVRVVLPGAWRAFTYSSAHAPRPELGLEGDGGALYAWLLRVRHRFPLRLSPDRWHRVCLRRDGWQNSFSLEVDGVMRAQRTVIADAIPASGTLLLGCSSRGRPPGATPPSLGKVELYLFRVWDDVRYHDVCEDGTVIGWNARYWGVSSPKAGERDQDLLCDHRRLRREAGDLTTNANPPLTGRLFAPPTGFPSTTATSSPAIATPVTMETSTATGSSLVNCGISQLCSNTTAYFWLSVRVEVQDSANTQGDAENWVSNVFSCHGDGGFGGTDFCQGGRQLQVEEVNCKATSSISQTVCDVLLQLSPVVSACELQQAGAAALQSGQRQSVQATIVGVVERVGRNLCGGVAPSGGGFVRCTSTSPLQDICEARKPSQLQCSVIDSNSSPATQSNTDSCSSDAPRFCDCTAFCNSANQFYAIRISVNSASVNIDLLKTLFSTPGSASTCKNIPLSTCQNIIRRYQRAHLECHGTQQRLYSCMVILEMSGSVNSCFLGQLVQRRINSQEGIRSEGQLTRMMACSRPGLSVSQLLASNLTWVASDLLTSDVCNPDPTLLECEAEETLAVLLTDSCPPEPSTTAQSTTAQHNITTTAPLVTNTTTQTTGNTTATPQTSTSRGTTQPNMTTGVTTLTNTTKQPALETTTAQNMTVTDNTTTSRPKLQNTTAAQQNTTENVTLPSVNSTSQITTTTAVPTDSTLNSTMSQPVSSNQTTDNNVTTGGAVDNRNLPNGTITTTNTTTSTVTVSSNNTTSYNVTTGRTVTPSRNITVDNTTVVDNRNLNNGTITTNITATTAAAAPNTTTGNNITEGFNVTTGRAVTTVVNNTNLNNGTVTTTTTVTAAPNATTGYNITTGGTVTPLLNTTVVDNRSLNNGTITTTNATASTVTAAPTNTTGGTVTPFSNNATVDNVTVVNNRTLDNATSNTTAITVTSAPNNTAGYNLTTAAKNYTTAVNNHTTLNNVTTPAYNTTAVTNHTTVTTNITTVANNFTTPVNNHTTVAYNFTTVNNQTTAAPNQTTVALNYTTVHNFTTIGQNVTTVRDNPTTGNNVTSRASNYTTATSTTRFNVTTAANNYTTVNNVTTVADNYTTVAPNHTTVHNITTAGYNITTAANNYTTVSNMTTGANNHTTAQNITMTTVSQNKTTSTANVTTTQQTTQVNTTAPDRNTTMSTTATTVTTTPTAESGNTTTTGVTLNITTTNGNDTVSTTAATVNPNVTTGTGLNQSTTANTLNQTTVTPEDNSTTTTSTTAATSQLNTTTVEATTVTTETTTQTETTSTTKTTEAETTQSQEDQVDQLLDQTQDGSTLNSSQVADLADRLEKLLEGPTVSESVGKKAITVVSNLLESDSALSGSANKLIQVVDDVAFKLDLAGESGIISSTSLVVAVKSVDGTDFPSTSVDIVSTDSVQLRAFGRSRVKRASPPLGSVLLPPSLTSGLSPEQQQQASRVQFTFYTKSALFQDVSLTNQTVVSPVLGCSVANLSISNLSEDIQFTIRNVNPISGNFTASCAFWDFSRNDGGGGWSTAGCSVVNATADGTICSCNHLTSFAILLDLGRQGIVDRQHAQILTFITYIGCGISAIFLAVTLLTYLSFEKLLRDIPAKILVQLCLSLLLLNMVFLLDGWLALYPAVGLCISTAFFLHYFLLTSFTWAGLEALHMYLSIVRVFTPYLSRYMLKFSLVGWGVPLIPVIIIIAVDKDNYGLVTYGRYTDGTTDDFCWLRNDIAFYVGVVAYFLLIFAMCLVVFVVVMVQLSRIKRQNPQNQAPNRGLLTDLRSIAGLVVLLGLTWGFALFAWGPLYLPFVYLFTIFNTLQGFLIFILHCAIKENVRRQWRTYLCCGKLRLAENSDWSRTATQNRHLSVATATTSAPHLTSRSSSVTSDGTNSSGSVFMDSGISDGSSSDVILNELHRRNMSQ